MSFKASKLCLQGGGSDEAFAHAIDTDNAAAPALTVLDWLSARAAKKRRQLGLGKGA
jgi:hypothetical protein